MNDKILNKFFSKKCLMKNIDIKNEKTEIFNNILSVLNIMSDYDRIFGKENDLYANEVINEKDLVEFRKLIKKRKTVSLCLIVKNEERCISRFLNKHIDYFDEIIIVDTGSSDNTMNIISTYSHNYKKIKIFNYDWKNDFSAARNYAKSKAKNDWIFFLDADEYIEFEGINKLYDFLKLIDLYKNKESMSFSIKIQNINSNILNETMQRILFNNSKLNYYGRVHEYVKLNDFEIENNNCCLNIVAYHDGYEQSVINHKNKISRNLTLLGKMLKEDPYNLRWLYYYTRDSIYDPNIAIIKRIYKYYVPILENNLGMLYVDNIIINFIIIYLICGNLDFAKEIINRFNNIELNNYDFIYYKILIEYIICKNKLNDLLKIITNYRKNNFDIKNSQISMDGYHIDLLIGMLLFENGNYNAAKKYFDFIEGKLDDNLLFTDFETIKSLLTIL